MTGEELREKFFEFLLRKACTSRQAREFLAKHDTTEPDILMEEAEAMGLIDDLAYARLFVDGHLSWGNMKISYELGMRGISRGDVAAALEEAEDECDRACELAESWRKSGLEERKIAARLASRGFTNRAVNSIKGS